MQGKGEIKGVEFNRFTRKKTKKIVKTNSLMHSAHEEKESRLS